MMRKTITRTLATSEITGYKVAIKDGKPEVETLPVLTVAGKAKEKDALKALEKEYGNGVTVGKIEVTEAVYEISVDDFIKYAKKQGSEASEEGCESGEDNAEVEQATEA